MGWTDERVVLLKRLWVEGKTAGEIAKLIGGGVTRNAVLGKVHRLKLSGRISPIQENTRGALVMDLVRHDVSLQVGQFGEAVRLPSMAAAIESFRSLLFVTGAESHPDLAEVMNSLWQPHHLRVIPTLNSYVGDMSVHGAFRRHGVPYLFLSCGTWEHYHMPTDTPDRLNYDKMAAITHYVLALLSGQDRAPLAGRTGKPRIHETLALESSFIRDALGNLSQPILNIAGIEDLRTRKDMDRFVRSLLSMGLG